MNEIIVQLREPTDAGRIYYFRDSEVENHLLFIESPIRRKMDYVITVSDNIPVVLMFDAYRCLINVECIIRRRGWRIVPHLKIPEITRAADIALVGVRSHHSPRQHRMRPPRQVNRKNRPYLFLYGALSGFSYKSYYIDNVPASVYCTDDYAYAQILFGKPETDAGWFALSDQCLALVIENRLKGFFVKLAGAPIKEY